MAVFDTPATVSNYLDNLVGPGKKYADAEALAKAYAHADETITDRNRELGELRTELEKRETADELFRRFEEHQRNVNAQPPATPQTPNQANPAATPLDESSLVDRVRNRLKAEEEADRKALNVNEVANRLVQIYGSEEKAQLAVKAKADELGVSTQFLQDVAASSPKAFYTQLGVDAGATATPSVSRSDVNSVALASSTSGPKAGTYQWYEQLRRENPTRYFDPKIQNQLFEDAKRLGDSFFA